MAMLTTEKARVSIAHSNRRINNGVPTWASGLCLIAATLPLASAVCYCPMVYNRNPRCRRYVLGFTGATHCPAAVLCGGHQELPTHLQVRPV